MKKWNELPKVMQNDKVKYYYDILQEHTFNYDSILSII